MIGPGREVDLVGFLWIIALFRADRPHTRTKLHLKDVRECGGNRADMLYSIDTHGTELGKGSDLTGWYERGIDERAISICSSMEYEWVSLWEINNLTYLINDCMCCLYRCLPAINQRCRLHRPFPPPNGHFLHRPSRSLGSAWHGSIRTT